MAGVKNAKVEKNISNAVNPKEFCTVKEFLEDVDIGYEDYKEWNDGSCTFLIPNLREEQISTLKEAELHSIGYGMFHSENAKLCVNDKLRYIKPHLVMEEKSKWDRVINRIIEIERKCSSEGKKCPFEPSILQLQISAKWSGTITTNMAEFKDFVTELNNFFVESLKDNIDGKCKEHNFWRTLIALRHGYSHDTTKWREEDRLKIANQTRDFFQDAIQKEQPHTSVSFVTCQFKLLDICSDFLEFLSGEVK